MFSFSRQLLFALTLVLSHLFVVLGYLFGLAWVGERWFMSCSLCIQPGSMTLQGMCSQV